MILLVVVYDLQSMTEALETQVKSKVTIKVLFLNHCSCDEVIVIDYSFQKNIIDYFSCKFYETNLHLSIHLPSGFFLIFEFQA